MTREDLVLFINACFACTGQREYYGAAESQRVSIAFLHDYILGNYRRLYARTLAAGINHFNRALIVARLLAAGAPADAAQRAEEGRLIAACLADLPPQRVYRLFDELRRQNVNNRRSRALLRGYLERRPDLAFDAVKYRRLLRSICRHGHVRLPGELWTFLSRGARHPGYQTPLLESFRRAHHDRRAVYELPYTVAEGLAARHGIPRDEFLAGIENRLTAGEQVRLAGARADLGRAPLTRVALYLCSLEAAAREADRARLESAMTRSAHRALRRAPLRLGKVAAVLDRSRSSSGSTEKRRRPLAVALAASRLLRACSAEYRAFWSPPAEDELTLRAAGQTDLATPLLDALDWGPELLLVVSDGFENDPPGALAEIARLFRTRIDPHRRTTLIHLNPVFDAADYAPRALSPHIPTVGLRDAEDLPTMIGFARFASGGAPLSELEAYLGRKVEEWLAARS